MNKTKIGLTIALSISLIFNIAVCILIAFYYPIFNSVRTQWLNTDNRSSHPIVRHIGWILDVNWKVISLTAQFKHENFDVTNSEGIILIKGKIEIANENGWETYIDKLFVNQRYDNKIAVIEIEPKFKKVQGIQKTTEQTFTINEKVENRAWGMNEYKVLLGNSSVYLQTHQKK